MKIFIDTTADPKNALIAGQADNQAATMPTLFYGDVLPFQVMFTDGAGNPAEFSGQANNEIIFAIGYLIPRQTIAQTATMYYANNCYYADLDLNTTGLENALAGNDSVSLTFEIQRKNGGGHSTTLVQGDCTVRNQLNLFSPVNLTVPVAPNNIILNVLPVPDAPSEITLADVTPDPIPTAPSEITLADITSETIPAAPSEITLADITSEPVPDAPSQITLATVPAAPSNINLILNLIDSVTQEAHGQFPGTGTFSSETGAGDITINNENYSSAYAFSSDGANFSYYQTLNFNNDGTITLVSTDEFDNNGNNSNYGNDTTYNLGTWTTSGINFNTNWHGVGEDYINNYFNNFKLVYGEIQTVPAAPGVPTVSTALVSVLHNGNTTILEDDTSTITIATHSNGNDLIATRNNNSGTDTIEVSSSNPAVFTVQGILNCNSIVYDYQNSNNNYLQPWQSKVLVNNQVQFTFPYSFFSDGGAEHILAFRWKNAQGETIETKYYKIDFAEI